VVAVVVACDAQLAPVILQAVVRQRDDVILSAWHIQRRAHYHCRRPSEAKAVVASVCECVVDERFERGGQLGQEHEERGLSR
jgi:hypothetical protein